MSMKYLGDTLDIHCGGVDNIFPHHENEIAQSEAATGHPFVRFWVHGEHLLVEGEKMAKSKGNFHTLRDLVARGHDPRAIRYLLLMTHYRSTLNFTFEALARAGQELARLDALAARLESEPVPGGSDAAFDAKVSSFAAEFKDALTDDLNVSGAQGALFRIVREANAALDRKELPAASVGVLRDALSGADRVLGVLPGEKEMVAPEVEAAIERRAQARAARDFAAADRIRRELLEQGIVLEDTPQGVRWRRAPRSAPQD